ncbi:putative ribonuclease H-like domain-containing protein [Tanacetum coccineum]
MALGIGLGLLPKYDIIFGLTNKELCTGFEKLMKDKFQMSSMGELTFFLGLQVQQKEDGIFISQDKYVAEILRNSTTLISMNWVSLMYLTSSRQISCLQFDIPWQFKKQIVVATSITESEYVAAASCYGQVKHVEYLMLNASPLKHIKRGRNKNQEPHSSVPPRKVGDRDWSNKELGEQNGKGCHVTPASSKKSKQYSVNPVIYTSCIEQFWATAKVQTVNGVRQLQALVDKKKVIITESSIRRDLHLDDAEGTGCLLTASIFEELARMGYEKPSQKLTFYKAFFSLQWKYFIHTINQCLSAKSTAWNEFSSLLEKWVMIQIIKLIPLKHPLLINHLHIPNPRRNNHRRRLRDIDLQKEKDAQAQEIAALKKRIQRLERKKMSRPTHLKRLRKVGMTRRVESSEDQESLGAPEDASKQGRTKVDGKGEHSTKPNDSTAGEAVTTASVEVGVVPTTIEEITLAQTLIQIKALSQKVPQETQPPSSNDKGKGIMIELEVPLKRKDQIALDEQIAKRYSMLTNTVKRYRKAKKRRKKVERRQLKAAERRRLRRKAGTEKEHNHEPPRETKFGIRKRAIDYNYLTTQTCATLRNCTSRETLWRIVKAKYGDTRPDNEFERVLLGDLKVVFEPDIKSYIWRMLQGYRVTIWKLIDSSGVHFVRRNLKIQKMNIKFRGGLLGLKRLHGFLEVTTAQVHNGNYAKMIMTPIQITKFVNHLQPEWSRFVIAAKQVKDLQIVNFNQLYAFLKQNENEANEVRAMRQRYPDLLSKEITSKNLSR